jgi:hypothetical protein
MQYSVSVKRRFKYVKTYRVIKRVNDQSNAVSRFVQALLEKYLVKGKGT